MATHSFIFGDNKGGFYYHREMKKSNHYDHTNAKYKVLEINK